MTISGFSLWTRHSEQAAPPVQPQKEKGGAFTVSLKVPSSRMRRGGDRPAFTSLKSGGRRRLRISITEAPGIGSEEAKDFFAPAGKAGTATLDGAFIRLNPR